jgi:hypothetical protein
MVKNVSTIDRSKRIRIGKHVPDEQPINTVIINASDEVISPQTAGTFVAPIRQAPITNSNTLAYVSGTGEIIDTGIAPNQAQDLEKVVIEGNTTSNTVEFRSPTTAFVTSSNVGISNLNPIHKLDVGDELYVDDSGLTVRKDALIEGNLTVLGDTTLVSSENLNIKDAIIELGKDNTDSDFTFDLGLILNRPTSNVAVGYRETSNEFIIGYTQSSANERYIIPETSNLIDVRIYGDVTANSFIGDGSFLSNVVQDTDLESNVAILRSEISSNAANVTTTLRTDLQSNVTILRDEIDSNLATARTDIQSNVSILRDEMKANTVTLRSDLQSNVSILRDEMEANTVTLRSDLQSNISILRGEMEANTVTLRSDLQSNVSILRGEMEANTVTLRSDLQSNVTILRGEIDSNLATARTDLQSNVTTLRGEIDSNLATARTDLQSNVTILRGEIDSNLATARTDLQSNVTILRDEMAANTITMRDELQSNLALKANIESPVFTGIITGDGAGLSNVTLQQVTQYGNTTSNTIEFTNSVSLVTSGYVGVNTPNPQKTLHVAGEILADDDITGVDFYGNDGHFGGSLYVDEDVVVQGNLEVYGNTTFVSTQNLLIEDPIIGLGNNNPISTLDTGIIMSYNSGSNVALGYRGDEGELIISHTMSSPSDHQLIPDTSNSVNVHVYGQLVTDSNVGIANTNPVHTLDVGSKFSVDENGSNIVNVSGNISATKITLGSISIYAGYDGYGGGGSTIDTSNTVNFSNATTGITVDSNVVVGGNVTANIIRTEDLFLSNVEVTTTVGLEQVTNVSNTTSNTVLLQNLTTGLVVDSNVVVGGNITALYYKGDGSNLTNVINYSELESNVSILRGEIDSNLATARTDLQSNVTILRGEIDSNLATARTDLQSNVTILRDEIDSNLATARTDLQSNVTILRGEIDSNLATARTDLQSNVSILRDEIDSNLATARTDFQSNVTILRDEIDSNLATARTDLQSNVTILRDEIDSNFATARTDLQSNVTILRDEIDSNLATARTDLQSNVTILRDEIDSNLATARTDLQSNVTILRDEIDSNLATARTDLQSNVTILRDEINSNLNSNVSRIQALESGTITISGEKTFENDIILESNLRVNGNLLVANTINMIVSDPIIELGANNLNTGDIGIIMTRHGISESNVTMFYDESEDIFNLGYTTSNAYNSTIAIETGNPITMNVHGNVEASHFIGDGSRLTGIASNLHSIINNGNVTSNTVQFINPDVGIVATGNIQANHLISNFAEISGNVEVGTANLFVDTTTYNVGIGTNTPIASLDVRGDIYSQNMICQTQQYEYSSTGTVFVSSGTLTLLTCPFTPKYSNSKILIQLSCPVQTSSTYFNIFVDRGSSRITSNPGNYGIISYNSGTNLSGHLIHTGIGYDLPGTTSTINYNVVAEYGSGSTLTILTQSGKLLVFIHELCQ